MAIFQLTSIRKKTIDQFHQKKRKITRFTSWSLTFQRFHRAQNALGKFKKTLRRSLISAHRKFIEQYLKGFFHHTKQTFQKFIMATKQQVGLSTSAKDVIDASAVKKPSIFVVALNLFQRFLCLCVRFVVVKVHGEHGQSMPPIDDLLLLESASSIAEKIRTKKVK